MERPQLVHRIQRQDDGNTVFGKASDFSYSYYRRESQKNGQGRDRQVV
jgi:hypothetical protein